MSAKNVVLISASPKVNEKSVSDMLTAMAEGQMGADNFHITHVNVRKSITQKHTGSDFEAMLKADALVIAFPLYFFCLPGILIRFLQDYDQFYKLHQDSAAKAKVYAVINCGFPEPGINTEAARVIESFSRQTGNTFRFAVLLGGGGMLLGAKDAPFMKKPMAAITEGFHATAQDIQSEDLSPIENVVVSMKFPRKLYFFMGNRGWTSSARKNGLKKEDLYRKPYRQD
nr:NAD(P)H-dependent oxidoreductase [uncultured Caproiciproducens sp.]